MMFLYALILIWALIIFVFSSIQNPSNFGSSVIFSIVFHLVEYIILAFLVTIAFHRTNRFSNLFFLVGVPLILVALYAASDEIHQSYVDGRQASVKDFYLDVFGASLGIFCARLCIFLRSRLTQ